MVSTSHSPSAKDWITVSTSTHDTWRWSTRQVNGRGPPRIPYDPSLMTTTLNDTTAVVTGGASGMGEATARRLAEAGATIVILDRDAAKGEKVAAELGGRC